MPGTSMIVSLPIYLARYGESYVIARSFGKLEASASGESAEEARARLNERLAARLESMPPRRLASLDRELTVEHRHLVLPLYRDRRRASPTDEAEYLTVETDLWVEREPGASFARLQSGLGHAPYWSSIDDEAPQDSSARWPGLEGRLANRQSHDTALRHHRARADEVELEILDVAYTPIALRDRLETSSDLQEALTLEASPSHSSPEDVLASWGRCWTDASDSRRLRLEPTFGRDELLGTIRQLVCGKPPTPVVLVGRARVGKSALIRHLAALLGDDPEATPDLWEAELAHWPSNDGETDRRSFGRLVDALETRGDLLYLGRLHALLASDKLHEKKSSARRLASAIDDRPLSLVAEASPETWQKLEMMHPSLANGFEVVRVRDPDDERGAHIVRQAVQRQSRDDVEWADGAIDRLWSLHRRFVVHASPVGSAIDFAERLLEQARLEHESMLTTERVEETFGRDTGLPAMLIRSSRALDLEEVENSLNARVIGQEEAVREVVDVVGVAQAEIGARDRPFGSFVFVGPTGVGKTELARALADYLFGDEEHLVRLDMSEYGQPDDDQRLVGARGEEGTLTAPVRRDPFSIVLLDELEKAHENVFDTLLQVIGEARLTDADGRTTRFHNTMFIMTSNLGLETSRSGDSAPTTREASFREAVEAHFRPEFLGRIDRIVPFQPLSRSTIRSIARRHLDAVAQRRGLVDRHVTLEVDSEVLDHLAELGWNPRYGARPVRRVVERRVSASVARTLSTTELDDDRRYCARALLDNGTMTWELERIEEEVNDETDGDPTDHPLLALLDEATSLRRQLRTCLDSTRFKALEARLDAFEQTSQAEDFWQREGAAEQAQRAEELREFVEPARDIEGELEAIEELAREAFHSRSDELTSEIRSQIEALHPRVESIRLQLLQTALDDPDHIVLLFPADEAEDEWRDQLVEWYRDLARRRGWTCRLWQGIPPGERDRSIGIDEEFKRDEVWRTQRSPHGRVVAVEYEGRAVRAFMRHEEGKHRLVEEASRETTEVHVPETGNPWPHPDTFQFRDPLRHTARTWNLRDGVVTMPETSSSEFHPERPWDGLFEVLETKAMELLDEAPDDHEPASG